MLAEYLQVTQGFLRDRDQRYLNPDDLIGYINRARREIALRTQCVRVLTPISGSIESIQLTNGGANYNNPTVVISAPDSPGGQSYLPNGMQATATAQQIGGVITNISVSSGGAGYANPVVTISDTTGDGATAVANVTPISVTQGGQEVYPFSLAPLSMFPGVGEIFAVNSVSFIYANYRYSLPCYSFSTYQAHIRQYPRQYLYIPTMCAQFGQGTNGSLYMYPIPSSLYQMEWDCFCLPSNLTDDQQPEALAGPWTDCVPYFAAHLAFLELQALNNARFYLELFDTMVHRYSAYTRPGRVISQYGRY